MNTKVNETIFRLRKAGDAAVFTIEDIPQNILNDGYCEIDIIRDEGYYSENNSWDPFSELIISRWRNKTSEELQKDKEKQEIFRKESRDRRYLQYLKLKEEFELEG